LQLVNSRFAIVDEGQRKSGLRQNEMAEQVNNFEAKVANDIGGIFTQALGQGLGKFIAPAKEMLPQPPDLSIDTLVEKHRKVRKKAQRKSLGENPLVTTIARLKCDRGFKGGASHSLIVN